MSSGFAATRVQLPCPPRVTRHPPNLLTIASAHLSLKMFGKRRLVSQGPERCSGLWLFNGDIPVLVLPRNSALAYLSTVTVAPVTSTIRGVPSEVVQDEEDGMKSPCAVNLHNAVTVSQKRMRKRVARAARRSSLGCDSNQVQGTSGLSPRIPPVLAEVDLLTTLHSACLP